MLGHRPQVTERPGEPRGAPRGIDDPAGLDRGCSRGGLDRKLRRCPGRILEVDHARGAQHVDTGGLGEPVHVLVQDRPIDVVAREQRLVEVPELRGIGQRADPLVLEPVALPVLGELLGREVAVEAELARQEPRSELDDRLADLPVELGFLLDENDTEVGMISLEKQRGRRSRERPPDDRDVVAMILRTHVATISHRKLVS
jgi:hypothetical protein